MDPHQRVHRYTTTSGMLTMDIANEVIDLLDAAGFDTTADFGTRDAFEVFNDGEFEMFALRLVRTPGTEGLGGLFEVFRADAPRSEEFPGFPDVWGPNVEGADAFSRMLDEFKAELDPDRRIDLLIRAEDVLVENMIIIPLVKRNGDAWAFHDDRITGPTAIDLHNAWLANLHEWRRVDG